jgi:phosphoribosyl-ATP pyrophosphohydrolase
MTDSVERLYEAVLAAKGSDPAVSRTSRLLRAGRAKIAKKLAEEAVEVVIDAMNGDREAVVRESADLLYNLVVVWATSGVRPADVWTEMGRREQLFGIAEKLLKNDVPAKSGASPGAPKVPPLPIRRARQRR